MAGTFEVFLDSDSLLRFRLKAPDGTVMAVSGAFADKPAVAAGIAAIRECAGTGLVTDLSAAGLRDQRTPAPAPYAAAPAAAAEPACDEQRVPVSRVRAFAHFDTVRGSVPRARWTGAV
ncbi:MULTISPECIES: DUF1508 domain-containing protein [unclassified Arthrobacter]|uniref:YegP family protein n=1 Tax=unclassified Arthrobacter TaxID=235627 RepID=UPI003396DCCC